MAAGFSLCPTPLGGCNLMNKCYTSIPKTLQLTVVLLQGLLMFSSCVCVHVHMMSPPCSSHSVWTQKKNPQTYPISGVHLLLFIWGRIVTHYTSAQGRPLTCLLLPWSRWAEREKGKGQNLGSIPPFLLTRLTVPVQHE